MEAGLGDLKEVPDGAFLRGLGVVVLIYELDGLPRRIYDAVSLEQRRKCLRFSLRLLKLLKLYIRHFVPVWKCFLMASPSLDESLNKVRQVNS